MPKINQTPWQKHVYRWKDCTKCPLHETRTKIVLARGKVPCDALFIGEAPGPVEDEFGLAFMGPAGHLLDSLIEEADPGDLRLGFTNLIACLPAGDDGVKFTEPPKDSIMACSPRLVEFVELCNPKIIIFVGQYATKWGPKFITPDRVYNAVSIIHPGALLRAEPHRKPLQIQLATVTLRDAFDSIR